MATTLPPLPRLSHHVHLWDYDFVEQFITAAMIHGYTVLRRQHRLLENNKIEIVEIFTTITHLRIFHIHLSCLRWDSLGGRVSSYHTNELGIPTVSFERKGNDWEDEELAAMATADTLVKDFRENWRTLRLEGDNMTGYERKEVILRILNGLFDILKLMYGRLVDMYEDEPNGQVVALHAAAVRRAEEGPAATH
ncbi:hypothetical protein BJ508DRAFT_321443 [Ascobolus immersus RN42]|uniref:Uncharacterized protein n=1 Tax=Ascobolus immersus RN42 TaxID=1160509 RepID=A0A3N4IRM3_ASCIM|nr:hypothetical protein BJ508DRAFT_321443 [Ascobolus immersus RN42]